LVAAPQPKSHYAEHPAPITEQVSPNLRDLSSGLFQHAVG